MVVFILALHLQNLTQVGSLQTSQTSSSIKSEGPFMSQYVFSSLIYLNQWDYHAVAWRLKSLCQVKELIWY